MNVDSDSSSSSSSDSNDEELEKYRQDEMKKKIDVLENKVNLSKSLFTRFLIIEIFYK